jgi:hypothetical protein
VPGLNDAILNIPPGATGATADPTQNYATDVTSTASAVELVLPNGVSNPAVAIPPTGCYVTWISTVDCHIRVGKSDVGDATTADSFIAAGARVDWWHLPGIKTHFSVIRADGATGDGSIKRNRSSGI